MIIIKMSNCQFCHFFILPELSFAHSLFNPISFCPVLIILNDETKTQEPKKKALRKCKMAQFLMDFLQRAPERKMRIARSREEAIVSSEENRPRETIQN